MATRGLYSFLQQEENAREGSSRCHNDGVDLNANLAEKFGLENAGTNDIFNRLIFERIPQYIEKMFSKDKLPIEHQRRWKVTKYDLFNLCKSLPNLSQAPAVAFLIDQILAQEKDSIESEDQRLPMRFPLLYEFLNRYSNEICYKEF